jgi:DNA-binding NarL/FixJ family response regulator
MFASRVQAAAAAANVPLLQITNPAQLPDRLAADSRLVLIDLTLDGVNLPAVVQAVHAAAPSASVVAYGPHVDHKALAAAADAGCDQVLSRGQFDRSYRELIDAVAK